ncbi:hypothetical protein GCM10018785_50660 [Streptomyces longispororuber]|uniref:Uncharacterized protein n=1 Tax=Streptomyces longispororuber TaxID=68230 RepID=A0A919DRU3_9ACTN|nr:hypothetical protein GCM10018785_50660 [Streptomyces longispororuber]
MVSSAGWEGVRPVPGLDHHLAETAGTGRGLYAVTPKLPGRYRQLGRRSPRDFGRAGILCMIYNVTPAHSTEVTRLSFKERRPSSDGKCRCKACRALQQKPMALTEPVRAIGFFAQREEE